MFNVKKRDGSLVEFDIKKIKDAIEKAFVATKKEYVADVIELLALRATADFTSKVKNWFHIGLLFEVNTKLLKFISFLFLNLNNKKGSGKFEEFNNVFTL